jgi:hypothetical protein
MLSRSSHALYRNGEAVFLMALSHRGEPLGRLAMLDDSRFNQHNGTNLSNKNRVICLPDRSQAAL